MLSRLRLQNFVVLDDAEVDFASGLTVITGESGSGKSVFAAALGLLLGGRAELDTVREGNDEASIEAVFEMTPELKRRLEDGGLPSDGDEVCVRRLISRAGKGRVYVNGSLTTVSVVARVLRGLVDVGGQHDSTMLFDAAEHLALVDRFAQLDGDAGPRARYHAVWLRLGEAEKRLAALGGDAAQARARAQALAFDVDELSRFGPVAGEEAELQAVLRRLVSVEKLRNLTSAAHQLLDGQDDSVGDLVGRAVAHLADAQKLDPRLGGALSSVVAAQGALEDGIRNLGKYLDGLDADPARLAEVQERLDAIRKLARKHGVDSSELSGLRDTLAAQLDELAHFSESREALLADLVLVRAQLDASAEQLSQGRVEAGRELASCVADGLRRLGLNGAQFSVEVARRTPRATGADDIRLLFSANPGTTPRLLDKVASGGEASRVMLAIKWAIAEKDNCRCTVLDEPDIGLGGAAADAMGRLIKEISTHRQVLCVTHLAQVAVHADAHVKIEKRINRHRNFAEVEALTTDDGRLAELARMLSGAAVTPEARAAAQVLLKDARTVRRPRRSTAVRSARACCDE